MKPTEITATLKVKTDKVEEFLDIFGKVYDLIPEDKQVEANEYFRRIRECLGLKREKTN